MAEPTAYAMSQMMSHLTGREVKFSLTTKLPPEKKPFYGVYKVLPGDTTLVVVAEKVLIGSFGAALVGLPKETVLERIHESPLPENLRDAMHEVLNIASTLVCVDRRAVFQTMHEDSLYLPSAALDVLKEPLRRTQFSVSCEGYVDGNFSILWNEY